MKKILLLVFLAFYSMSFAQDESHEKIFFHNDTMSKYSKYSYSKTIKEFIKSEFVIKSKTNDSLKNQNNKEVKICLIIDKEGSVKIYENNSQNKIIDDLVINSIFKLPKAKPFVNDKGTLSWYAMTFVFKLDLDFIKTEVVLNLKENKKINQLEKLPVFKGCDQNLIAENQKNVLWKK